MTNDPESEFQSLLDSSSSTARPQRGDLLAGQVAGFDLQGMIVDLGLKRDGIVPQAEVDKLLTDGVTFEPGQPVSVVVTNPEDKDGNLIVSINRTKHQKDWLLAEQLLASSEMWEGMVTGHNRGGLIVKFGDIQAFVPSSHVTDLPRGVPESERPARLQALVGKRMGFKVIEVDRERRRLVLSQRNAQKEYREKQKSRILDELAEGQVRKGVVTGLRDFGAFVDLGGADGLIHVSELAWQRVRHPSEVLRVGQEVEVEVLKVDRENKRIGLSLKRRQPDPWAHVGERFQVGQVVTGTVVRVATFGAFVDLGEGIDGLLHASQWTGSPPVAEGQTVLVKVTNIDPGRQRIGLELQPEAPAEYEDEFDQPQE
ncbi:MAG: 30S ribosomal protein S1 [Anaerolineales bacterium]